MFAPAIMVDPLTRSAIRQPGLEGLTPVEVASRLRHLDGLVFFDTAGNQPSGAALPVSVVAARPPRIVRGSIHAAADREVLQALLETGRAETPDRGFPMGGLCGWVGYEGAFVFGEYPEMLVYVHDRGEWWGTGALAGQLREPVEEPVKIGPFHSDTNRDAYLAKVRRAQEWIAAGDIYQVNLSQSFSAEIAGGSLFSLYESLREATPAPMAAWMSLDGREILSSSPELFLRIAGRGVETRPIKGTRPRFADPDARPPIGLRAPDRRPRNRRAGDDHRPAAQRHRAGVRIRQRASARDVET